MELTNEHYERIAHCFPKHRGTLRYANLTVLNAILYIAEHGAKWRGLPRNFGNWHTIYTRMRAWAKAGVLAKAFEALQQEEIIHIKLEVAFLDSTTIKVHPDAAGALKKTALKPSGAQEEDSRPRFIWLPQMSGQYYISPSRPGKAATARKAANSCNPGRSGRKASKS